MGEILQRWTDHKDLAKICEHAWNYYTSFKHLTQTFARTYILCQVSCGATVRNNVTLDIAFIRALPVLTKVPQVHAFLLFLVLILLSL